MAEKKTKDTLGVPAWHPDFRNNELLPDVKAVRTNFLVNFIALTLALASVGWLVYNEVQAMETTNGTEELRQRIDEGAAKNRQFIKLSKDFSEISPKAEDLTVFFDGYQEPLPMILAISESRPVTISLQSISLGYNSVNKGSRKKPKYEKSPRVSLSGVLKGNNAEALDDLDEYKATLQSLEYFEGRLDSIVVSKPSRNVKLDLFEFTIVINLKSA